MCKANRFSQRLNLWGLTLLVRAAMAFRYARYTCSEIVSCTPSVFILGLPNAYETAYRVGIAIQLQPLLWTVSSWATEATADGWRSIRLDGLKRPRLAPQVRGTFDISPAGPAALAPKTANATRDLNGHF